MKFSQCQALWICCSAAVHFGECWGCGHYSQACFCGGQARWLGAASKNFELYHIHHGLDLLPPDETLETQWANLRRGTRSLAREEIESVAVLLCSYYVARFGNKSAGNVQAALESASGDKLWGKGIIADPVEDLPPTKWLSVLTDPDGSEKRAIEARSAKLADAYLRKQGLAVDADSRSRLAEAMATAMKYGSQIVLASDANGIFSANPFSPLPLWPIFNSAIYQVIDRQS